MVLDHDDANDLTQEIFVKIWKNLAKFRADSLLYTWIYRIATNECLTFLNKKKKASFGSLEEVETIIVSNNSTASIDGEAVQKKLEAALSKLPDKQRLVFNLKYFDELKYEDISEITSTSVGALKTSYHLAVKKIEEFIKSD